MKMRYRVVDVFTTRRFEGNPLAVFPDAASISDALMPRIARELNLSETVFVFPATSSKTAARLRIFTPTRELPFAGHPTVGTSFVLLDEGAVKPKDGAFALEENIGPVPVHVDEGHPAMIWLTTPPIREGAVFERSACAAALTLSTADVLDLQPQLVDAGNPALFIPLRDKAAVDRATLDMSAMRALLGSAAKGSFMFFFTPTAEGAYSRMFAPDHGVVEDPATGSATGPLALYMMRNGLAPRASGSRFVSEQGTKMGRRSFLHIRIRGEMGRDAIEVGGNVVPVTEASMTIDE